MRRCSNSLWILLFILLSLAACAPAAQAAKAPATQPPPAKKLQLIEFYSPMWMSCREERPIVHELEQAYGDRIAFVHVNILNPDSLPLMKQYGFNATPELYLVNASGKVIGFWDDVQSKEELEAVINKALN